MAEENQIANDNNFPNHGPEDYADMANGLTKIIANAFMKSENMLPAKVISYDRTANTAIVQPLIKIVMTASNYSRGQIGPIPVFAFGAGNFVINFPIKIGDLGWIQANDRDISAFEQSLAESLPATYRTHSFNDAVFFPDVIRNFSTAGEDGNMVIQSLDGTTKISLGASQIHLVHPTKVLITSPLSEISQDLHVIGNINCDQTVTGNTDVVFAGISGKGHVHAKGTYTAPNGLLTGGNSDVPH